MTKYTLHYTADGPAQGPPIDDMHITQAVEETTGRVPPNFWRELHRTGRIYVRRINNHGYQSIHVHKVYV